MAATASRSAARRGEGGWPLQARSTNSRRRRPAPAAAGATGARRRPPTPPGWWPARAGRGTPSRRSASAAASSRTCSQLSSTSSTSRSRRNSVMRTMTGRGSLPPPTSAPSRSPMVAATKDGTAGVGGAGPARLPTRRRRAGRAGCGPSPWPGASCRRRRPDKGHQAVVVDERAHRVEGRARPTKLVSSVRRLWSGAGGRRRHRGGGTVERGVMGEDGGFEPLQVGAGLDAEVSASTSRARW